MSLFELTIRCLISFIILYLAARALGKKLISQITFFDFLSGITLGTIGATFILNNRISVANGVYAVCLFSLLSLLLGYLSLKSFIAGKKINGEPLLVIKNGKIYEEGMSHARLTVDTLLLLLRKKKIFYLDQVDFAFLETDGTLSPSKKPQEDKTQRGIPQTFIIDGKLMQGSLSALHKNKQWVDELLKEHSIASVAEIFVAQMDTKTNKVYIDKRDDSVKNTKDMLNK